MLFSSIFYLWVFLPTVLIINALLNVIPFSSNRIRVRAKNTFLLISSLIFYAWGGIGYLGLMIFVILINYFAGLLMESGRTNRKTVFVLAIILNLATLFYFKYFNLLIHSTEAILGKEKGAFGLPEVILPIGISFYIFQAMSYTIDLYRGKTTLQRNLPDFALYVSLFPQLIAGPIVIYNDIKDEIEDRSVSGDDMLYGIRRFCIGLGKKVIIANALAEAADGIWNIVSEDPTKIGAGVAWFGMIAYTFQIFYDFSGYSDMAIGLGRMFGFHFKENFDCPYISGSIREFWRRWHISLSSWFRDYVYIPLGGSRVKKSRIYINLLIVFLLTGIWHGANYTFFVWGLIHGVLIVIERICSSSKSKLRIPAFIGHIYTMLAVMIAWVFFRSDSISIAGKYISRLFAFGTYPNTVLNFCSMRIVIALVAAVVIMGIFKKPYEKFNVKYKDNKALSWVQYILLMLMLVYCIIQIVSGTYNPFIYFQF
ncbi:MAG: MBOAT family protein [Lachnospiraceae bacterium]|nr:MBOAT family protein [Lachnospiraceae bacterium]